MGKAVNVMDKAENVMTRQTETGNPRPSCGNDLTGRRFGSLTALRPTEKREQRRIVWECRCDCGETVLVRSQYLKDGSVKSCKSCRDKNRPRRDITGQRFGSLTALYPTEQRDRNQSVIWRCRCDCGNEVECSCGDLQRGTCISCGCRKRIAEEQLRDRTTHVAGTTVELLDKKVRCDNTTGVTGVTMYRGKYKVRIRFQGKTYSLGTYRTLEDAAEARKRAEECLFGEFLDFYDQWKRRAEADPAWGRENPVSVSVRRTETGDFRVLMLPRLA